jgi:iron complex transport system permease protein
MSTLPLSPASAAVTDARARALAARGKFLASMGVLAIVLFVVTIVATALGPVSIAPLRVWNIIAAELGLSIGSVDNQRDVAVVMQLRLPRILLAAICGAALAVAGAALQAVFRNPLAEPGVTGVSSGASLGAVAVLYWNLDAWHPLVLPLGAFFAAAATVAVVYGIAAGTNRSSVATLVLVGLAINAFLSGIVSAFVANARNEQEIRSIIFWLQGGLEARTWEHVRLALAPVLVGVAGLVAVGRDLNLLLLGDDLATSAGVAVRPVRWLILGLCALVTGAAVAVTGVISFVGLVIPHALRLVIGTDSRVLLPASALAGASFLVICDTIARMAFQPVTLQVGVVTSLIGGPLFLGLVIRTRKEFAL